ncbi:hypothetical protein [Lysinibacillus xylanilyticus]|nr:hypothetical protein [Lysinibacillus xylanilyticus]
MIYSATLIATGLYTISFPELFNFFQQLFYVAKAKRQQQQHTTE